MQLGHLITAPNGTSQCTIELSKEQGQSVQKKSYRKHISSCPAFRCTNATNTLQCLRDLPYQIFYNNAYEGLEWFATVDNNFISQYPQISYREGKFAQVPILLGTNTDEGTSFGTTGTNTDEDCIAQLICKCLTPLH
jgi:carboxylesterase type B